jgi:putative pyruvate formate lyase activating enzyme
MKCNLCGHQCHQDRTKGPGQCLIDDNIYISYYGRHFGEEPFFVGDQSGTSQGHGSGTIFFLGCNLRCRFCQNHQISRWSSTNLLRQNEQMVSQNDLVEIFFELKKQGALNINLVSPTPYVFQLARALKLARVKKLNLPIIYNSHGYDSLTALRLMRGLVDIYLPDAKYANDGQGQMYSGVADYVKTNQNAIREMVRQVGHLELANGIARKGLVVRHLVLPNNTANSFGVLDFLATLGKEITISLMAQYHARQELLSEVPSELRCTLSQDEYQEVIEYALKLGLDNCLTQDVESHDNYLPDFNLEKSFS